MPKNRIAKVDGLEPKQLQAAALLAEGATYKEAARGVGIYTETLRRWLNNPDFQQAFEDLTHESLLRLKTGAVRSKLRLLGLDERLTDALDEALQATLPDGTPDWDVRLQGIQLGLKGLDWAGTENPKQREQREVNARAAAAVLVVRPEEVLDA